ncbi:MAG: hypothetical protein A3H96_08400 [Acidobacteria bacterium RIFCSPLOWO2_02_FULL_67_36]|nr:MAG: hypothetical protein A3H96_08400 [Acidobacteria bacterium RIFCSPLOWO2_02_FULL_67_36]OFW22278.1 MAG: hypothetical protein A3G21_01680 [Acidobacteria bacterium RIFCSPLOWO2_12_FULL_66_21]
MGRSYLRWPVSTILLFSVCLAAPAAQNPAVQTPPAQPGAATAAPEPLSDAFIENFLRRARVGKTKGTKKGITGSREAMLSAGTLTHKAHIQQIDETVKQFVSMSGTEFNFRDSWMFNVAGYRIDRLLGLNLVPVSVERSWQGEDGSFTWWVDDVMMDEGERLKQKLGVPAPNLEVWNQQLPLVRIFDQLIANIDRNGQNLVITTDWRVWAIDHTRAFRTNTELKTPINITRCDRQVLERLKALDKPTLTRELRKYLTPYQIDALLARRDQIVSILEKAGPAALFDRKEN